MAQAFKRLQRVLDLEAKQGYQNKAVVGGIRQFVTFWVSQAREEAVDEADKALVEQIADSLSEYGRLPGKEARAKLIQTLMEKVQQRQTRTGQQAPTKAPQPKQAQKPKTQTAEKPAKAKPPQSKPKAGKKKAPPPAVAAPVEPDPAGLQQPVSAIKGVGPKIAEKLNKLGVQTIWDLLYLFPRRYDDYTLMKPIKDLVYGETVTIIGTIWETRSRRTRTNQVMVQAT
ncbi:MAG: hypothetical protein D6835_04415, partial [Candidatus Thermofonsia bacterium]